MNEHWENLKPRQWVVITQLRQDEEPGLFGMRATPTYDGIPMQIQAMSFPFLYVERATKEVGVIDFRRFQVATVKPEYVKKMKALFKWMPLASFPSSDTGLGRSAPEPEKQRSEFRHPCPVCEGPMVMKGRAYEPLQLTCEECGFRGGREEESR